MKKIKVTSLPLIEVIQDLATALGAPLVNQCDEYKMNIPSDIGIGYIQGLDFDGGIGLIQYDCLLQEELAIEFVENDVHPLKFLYCSKGHLSHRFESDQDDNHHIDQYQGVIVASDRKNGHVVRIPKNTHLRMTSIEINREKFVERYFCDLESLHPSLKNLFLDVHATNGFYQHGDFSLQLSELIDLMSKYKHQGFVRRLYLESKAYELLSTQIHMYEDDVLDEPKRSILRKSEVAAIHDASTIINENVKDIDSIDTLSKRVGMNAHKLQEGFQYFFHQSVNQYIQNARLNQAKELLKERDKSIAHIAELVGWSSTSHFNKMFKEKMGLTPSQYRNTYMSNFKSNNGFSLS